MAALVLIRIGTGVCQGQHAAGALAAELQLKAVRNQFAKLQPSFRGRHRN